MAGNRGSHNMQSVEIDDLIAQFVTTNDHDSALERMNKEAILKELASRVLNSSINSSHSVEPEFLVNEIKRHITLTTGSNRKAVEFDMAAQRFLVDKSFARQPDILNFIYRLSLARGNRDSNQKTVIDLVSQPTTDIVERLGKTKLDHVERVASPTPSSSGKSHGLSAAETYQLTVQKVNDLKRRLDTISEQQLLADMMPVLRGVDGEFVVFDEQKAGFAMKPRIGLSGLTRGFVEQIMFYADHYKRISKRVTMREKTTGRIRTAYCQQVNRELALYSQEVVRFEEDLLGVGSCHSFLPSQSTTTTTNGNNGVKTLPELLLKLSKWRMFLLTLDSITNQLDGVSGPALLDGLCKYVDYDEHMTAKMTVRLFDSCAAPIIAMVDRFVRTGVIDDPHQEFFLATSESSMSNDDSEVSSTNELDWWEKRYVVINERIPRYLSGDVVKNVLSLGKTRALLNMGMDGADDTIMATIGKFDGDLNQNQVNRVIDEWERLSREQGKQAVAYLLEKCQLLSHLDGIKRFMLLAEGDFSRTLMELLADALSKPASSLLRHNLVAILESAGDRYPADYQQRLDVRLLESANPKSQGWDVFCLDYRLDQSLSVIVSPECMLEYARMSHFLWSLKRVEFALSGQWNRLTRSRRLFRGELAIDQRRLELLLAEMHTFIQQLLSAAYQAIEEPFREMVLHLQIASSVDQMIAYHGDFIGAVKKGFLPWSLPALRNKLGQICASCLRADSLGKHITNHAMLLHEKQRRERNLPVSVPEDRFQAFLATHTKQLAEHRATFQTTARHFQTELDEFIGALQREAATGADADKASLLLAMVDLSGYHSRRVGFDVKKYVK